MHERPERLTQCVPQQEPFLCPDTNVTVFTKQHDGKNFCMFEIRPNRRKPSPETYRHTARVKGLCQVGESPPRRALPRLELSRMLPVWGVQPFVFVGLFSITSVADCRSVSMSPKGVKWKMSKILPNSSSPSSSPELSILCVQSHPPRDVRIDAYFVIKCMSYEIYHLTISSMQFGAVKLFTIMYEHRHYSFPELFHHPKQKLRPGSSFCVCDTHTQPT